MDETPRAKHSLAFLASWWLFLSLGGYILACIPAIFVAEHFGWSQWPLHTTQLLATVLCIPSAAAFLWCTRGARFGWQQVVAILAVLLAGLWCVFVCFVMLTLDFSGID